MNRGQFKKGTSGNPAGRPAGSRNKATLLCEELLEGEAELITRKLIEKARNGDSNALRLCMERLLPARKERPINLDLRPIKTAQDLPIQFQDITIAIAEGRITPGEGESIANIVTSHAKAMESVEHDRRLSRLEEHLEDVKKYKRDLDNFVQGAFVQDKPSQA